MVDHSSDSKAVLLSVPTWFLVIYKVWEVQAMLDVKFQSFIHTLLVKAPFKNLFY